MRKKRAMIQKGCTVNKNTPVGQAYVTLNRGEDGHAFEVFIQTGKVGSEITSIGEAIGRAVSLLLQIPSELTPEMRLSMLIDQFDGVGGSNSVGIGKNRVRSLPDGIAKALRLLLDDHVKNVEALPVSVAGSLGSGVTPTTVAEYVKASGSRGSVDICPECGAGTYVREGGCSVCKTCGYSACG